MLAPIQRLISEDEYLAYDEASDAKHEYYAGQMVAMSGASEQHNLIASNLTALIRPQLRGKACRIYPSDMRIKVVQTGMHAYPDISVVCGTPSFTNEQKRDTLLNPTMIIEILSPSTERYDRGLKFQSYRTIASLQEYILVAQDEYRIERYTRQHATMWLLSEATGHDATLVLASVGVTLALAEVYEQVELRGDG